MIYHTNLGLIYFFKMASSLKTESSEEVPTANADGAEGGQRRRRKRGFDVGPDMGNAFVSKIYSST